MVAPLLPPDWRTWPEAQLNELLSGLSQLAQEREQGKVPWLCDIADCDGLPHAGRRGPHSRSEQRAPEAADWDNWVLIAGRGFGKTRTGAEWSVRQARDHERGALIGPTAGDARDILVEGESGVMACAPAAFRPLYEPSKRRLTYPNGAIQTVYSADEPDRLRGPQHHYAWADELAAWRRMQYAWDMLQMGMRLGEHPRVCITTTPRPLPLVKELIKSERSAVVRGSTYANLHNLAPTFRRTVLERYAGTTLGRQELDAEVLEDLPGALVQRAWINAARVDIAPALDLIVVAVDPAGTGTGDEAGIVVVGRGTEDGHAYVLADLSGRMSARATGLTAWRALYEYGAQHLVYEDNFGKQWLRDGLIDAYADHHRLDAAEREGVKRDETSSPYRMLRKVTAQHGKKLRAQPVAMRYEQGKVHHEGAFGLLEDQMCVVGGTLIETDRGHITVEAVRRGDRVMTRSGWAPVSWSGQTGVTGKLTGIHVVDCVLWTTTAHPVWSASRGRFVRADSVTTEDALDVRRSPGSSAHPFCGMAIGGTLRRTGTTGAAERVAQCSFTEPSGPPTTGRFRMAGTTYTTLTKTPSTTRSGISNSSPSRSTERSMHPAGSSWRTPHGVENGAVKSGRVANPALSSAPGADRSSSRQGSARPTVGARVIDVLRVPVYNLMVDDGYPPEYYANGVLVHNCTWLPDEDSDSPDRIDALVHGVTFLLGREKAQGQIASPHALGLGRARGGEHPLLVARRRAAS